MMHALMILLLQVIQEACTLLEQKRVREANNKLREFSLGRKYTCRTAEILAELV